MENKENIIKEKVSKILQAKYNKTESKKTSLDGFFRILQPDENIVFREAPLITVRSDENPVSHGGKFMGIPEVSETFGSERRVIPPVAESYVEPPKVVIHPRPSVVKNRPDPSSFTRRHKPYGTLHRPGHSGTVSHSGPSSTLPRPGYSGSISQPNSSNNRPIPHLGTFLNHGPSAIPSRPGFSGAISNPSPSGIRPILQPDNLFAVPSLPGPSTMRPRRRNNITGTSPQPTPSGFSTQPVPSINPYARALRAAVAARPTSVAARPGSIRTSRNNNKSLYRSHACDPSFYQVTNFIRTLPHPVDKVAVDNWVQFLQRQNFIKNPLTDFKFKFLLIRAENDPLLQSVTNDDFYDSDDDLFELKFDP